jgi:hypothetical protein
MKNKKLDPECATITVTPQASYPHTIRPPRFESDVRTIREDARVFHRHNGAVHARLRRCGFR